MMVQARVQLFSSVRLLTPHVVTEIWIYIYDPFKYPRKNLSVGCTFHPVVRFVSLIDPDLIICLAKKKLLIMHFVASD